MNKRILIYCRESRDDGGLFGRIETQRDILLSYVKLNGFTGEAEVVLDNNVSGTDFKRLEHIALRAETGQIDILVFKDASRLGRNLRESLNFLHRMDKAGVQVLFESESYDPELFPLLAWFNERRAAEDSRKVKRVFEHRMKTGSIIFKAPFGYSKENGRLVPDALTAGVVRKIFALRLAGFSTGEIATDLEENRLLNPSGSVKWNNQQIRRILENRCYIGDMVYKKTVKPSYQSKRLHRNPPENWQIIENNHEAIVNRADFAVAELIKKQNRRRVNERLCFTGLLYCGGCGAKMLQRRRKFRADGYICQGYHLRGSTACKSHFIREDSLIEMIFGVLKPYLEGDGFSNLLEHWPDNSHESQTAAKLAAQYEQMLAKIYDDRLRSPDMLLPEIFEKKLTEYSEKLSSARLLQSSLAESKPTQCEIKHIFETRPRYLRELFHHAFECATIYLPGELPNLEKALIKIKLRQ